MSVVDEVKDRLDIVEIVGESVDLKKSGKNYTGFCPFHSNTRTPAFVVFPDTGTWRCFGACNEGGDVFSFLMKKEGFDFPEALRLLADRAGVELKPRTPEQEAQDEERDHLRALLEAAVTYYRHQLSSTEPGQAALDYLHQRDMGDEIIESFELGYAPSGWETATEYFLEKGYQEQDLVEAGLASERDSGGLYDRFRNRLMIPIRDGRGRMAGFGARALDPDDQPKYLNSPQTELFDKGQLLYGLHHARKAIRSEDQAVIVEGYMDVIGLSQAGFDNAVSPMGTALSEAQLRQLKRYSRKMVLALDADAAGDRATLRGLQIARQALDRDPDPIFNARGLVRYEGRLDAEIRILTLPEGKDPDELVAADPESWPKLLAGAQTVVDYVTQVLSADRDLDDAKHKAEIAQQVMPLIQDVADPVERDAYRQKLARHLKVDERTLLSYQRSGSGSRSRAGSTAGRIQGDSGQRQRAPDHLERFCLGSLLLRPDLLYQIDREMQEIELEKISARDFQGAENQEVFRCVRGSLNQHDREPTEYCFEHLGEDLAEVADEMVSSLPEMDLDEPKVTAEVVAAFLRLRKRKYATQLSQMQFQLMAAQERAGEDDQEVELDLTQLTEEVQRLTLQIRRLDQPPALRGTPAALRGGK
jgi:DNA primase